MKAGPSEPQVRGGPIDGVILKPVAVWQDKRGWLAEFFRSDEADPSIFPAMGYVSMTLPGVARGPHEHRDQTDWFCFMGPSRFRVSLWDARSGSPTRGMKMAVDIGEGMPGILVVPPGVIHAYRNIGLVDGLVYNCPNRLYAGPGRREPVDEIRHENEPGSPYEPE